MRNSLLLASTAALLAMGTARAELVPALPGYACAQLSLSTEQLRDPNALPAVLAAPSAGAPQIGKAGNLVAVRSPENVVGGYARMLHLNGREGWVRADMLRPYHAMSAPRARCAVVRRPGGIGFMTWTPGR